ncbi:NAD(P)/FAD-dependent oxidoreductase [Amycolatopsis sp.]|uniref:NAD(P)/FAD-dependent oxidoreductase n=1 Tax=Amycolatopsis sp. TaxID=37632 RepID=UPI002C564B81|nr:NAD(P)/FAD-dependent oxidoreductase [Amycolatopsis sp.]HVV12035.1 NAD(P)/FAD-dependent oxidoreductase [Amycolatopsis sp.]
MTTYDVIIVGARCAGSATAMLLARQGHRVLLVDRSRFPADTVSTHLIHSPGVAALHRWGLRDRLVATGCPPITRYSFDFGPFTLCGTPPTSNGAAAAYCPRRTVLDTLLIEAAAQAGVHVREGFTVHDLIVEDDRVVGVRGGDTAAPVTERATVVVGADGAHSRVAEAVGAPAYRTAPQASVAYYAYWSGFDTDAAQWMIKPGNGFAAFPTHDDLTLLLVAWPHAVRTRVKHDLDCNYLRALKEIHGDRLDGARRETRLVGSGVANHFRRPFGPGWALVGDAGYLLDPVTAQGMTDAFLDAELCAGAIHAALTSARPYDEAMTHYQQQRDTRVFPMYEFTAALASLQPPPPQLGRLLAGMAGDQQAMDKFGGVFAGTVSPAVVLGPPPP